MLEGEGGRGRRKGNTEAARVQMAPANAFIELPRNAIKDRVRERDRDRQRREREQKLE